MTALQFLFTFKIIAFCSFVSTFSLLWILKFQKESALAALETAAYLVLRASFKPVHYSLWLTSKLLNIISAGTLYFAEIISVFSRAFYRIISVVVQKAYAVAKSRYVPVFWVGLVFFLGAGFVSVRIQMPQPNTHDEFGYLLQADTFAHGRLTNPTHPLWKHFESFHIIQQPTYAAKYPPAQGLFLALGEVLTGHPIVGVWFSFALMMAALYWALKPFFPPGWALTGIFLGGLRMGFIGQPYLANGFGYWSQSYWGGAVAAFGGALIFGSYRRLWERPAVFPALLLGFGLAILANSRPYEGLLASLPLAIAFLYWLCKDKRHSARVKVSRVLVPLAALLLLTGSWMAYYNWRVTGDPFMTPYQMHETTYGMPSIFVGQSVHPKTAFNHALQKDYYAGYVQRLYAYHSSLKGFVSLTLFRVKQNLIFFFGILLFIPLLFLRKRDFNSDFWSQLFGLSLLAMFLGELPVERLSFPHYIAPVTFPIYYFVTQGLVKLREWKWRNHSLGVFAVGMILIGTIGELVVPLRYRNEMPFCAWHNDRARLLNQLKATEGLHLVIVRYAAGHSFHNEWVYNDADIDGAKVVWARGMSPQENIQLCRYFAGRHAWLVEADQLPAKLIKFEPGAVGS